jgi:hypothetical protein
MTDIEQKALALVNEIEHERGEDELTPRIMRGLIIDEALCRAIEQHEAFRQEVSDFRQEISGAIDAYWINPPEHFDRFIIPKPKPDPLVEAIEKCAAQMHLTSEDAANALRAALEARGLEIREKDKCQ